MGRYERLKTEIESGNGAQPLSESRYERLKKEMGESSSVSSTKTKKTKKPAPSSLDNRPKSETKKTTAAPPAPAPAKARKTNSGAVTKKSPVYIRSTKAAPAVDPSAYGYDPMVAQDLQNRAAQSKPGVMQALGARREGQTVYRVDDMPSLGTRVAGTVSGAAKTYGGSMAGLGAFALEAVKKLDESVSTSHRRAVNDAEHAREARLKLLSDSVQRRHGVGAPMTQEERDRLRKQAELDEARVRLAQEYQDKVHAPLTAASDALYRKGAEMEAAGQEDIERAKAGLGAVGRFGVDVGVAGLQMGMDYIPALLTGGSSALAPMFLRSAGGAAITGKESGADFSDRAVYALGSGALSAVTEQISNIAGPFRKMFGVGVADRIASRLVSRFGEKQTVQIMSRAAQTAAGRAALSAFGEGFEEVAEAVLQTPLQKATIDPDAKFDPVQAGYDFLVGAALGGLGGVSDAVLRNPGTQTQAPVSPETRAAEIQSIQEQAEQEAADWIESLNIPRPVDLNAVNAQADQDASAIVRDMFSQKPVQPTSPESVMKIIQDIQREQQARPGSILLNGDQLAQINREIAKQQAAPVDVDSLLKGRARLDYEQLAPDTQAAVDRAYEQGTAGMDAEGRIFRIHPEDHIDRRDAADIGRRRSLNAFQFDHPELHRFFADAAQWLKSGMGQKGGQIESAPGVLSDGITPSAHDRYWRTSRMQPEPVVRLLDEFGLSYAEIDKALDAIIKDKGQENYAAAKKVELVLDEMLTNGWTDLDGRFLPGIPEYVDATSKIAGSLNAEQEPDLGIMGQEIERLYGKQDAAPLTPDGQNGTILETSEMEETAYERREQERKEAYPESREDFLRRGFQPLEGGFESGEAAFRFRRPRNISRSAFSARQALIELGVPSVIVDGHVEKNLNGYTITHTQFEGGTMGKRLVAVNNNMSVSPLETAAHEAFHFWAGTKSRFFFEDIIRDQILYTSEAFKNYEKVIADGYFGAEIDLFDANSRNVFMEELFAHIAGHIHSCEYETMLRPMFRDYDAVKAAWNQLAEYGRSHPAEMPPSIQWGQETGPDLGILGREIERLYGKSDTTPSDGLGAADAGTVNTDYDRLQAQSSEFHPEGENPARPVDVPKQDFDGRNIPKAASTVTGAEILNNADVERLQQIIADGAVSFDTIHDADAQETAMRTVSEIGFEGALERYRQAARSNVATKNNVALGQLLMDLAAQSGNESALAEIFYLYTTNSTNIAQAMQAQAMLRKLSPESQLSILQKSVNRLNEKYGTDAEISGENMRDFLNAPDEKTRREVADRIVKDAAQSVPGTFRAKYDCLRYLAMLGNPRTHIRNILGNTLFQIPVTAKNRVGAAVEAGYNFFSGGKLERTKSLTGVNPASQLAKECRADWSNVSDFLSGSKYSEGRITARDIESEIDPFQNSNPLFKGLGKLSDMNGQLLSVEDTAAKRWIYTQSLAGYLKANGIKSISEADPQLLNRARNYAAQEAMRNTFNDHNAFSDFVAKLSALPNSENKWARRAGYVTEGLLPFKRTPANILSRAVEYSPVGAAASIADLVNRGVRGQATVESVATGIDRLAAGLTGTVLLAVGFLLNGYFSGGDDEDDKQRDFNSLTGHQSYALELENGTSVTLDWLAPEAIPFFMGVELAHAWQDGGLSWEDALNALKNMSGPMLEMSMLQGLNDVIEDASYAQYHGGNVPVAFIVSAATNYATQIFPTLFGQLERSTENRRMTTYADKNSPIAKDLQFFLGKTSQKIPGLDYHQIPYIDEWGREESSGDPISRTFNNILNPAYMSRVQIDNVEKELQRLKDTTGSSSVFPAKVDKSFKVGDEMKYLTADEYATFAKTVGQTRRDLLDRLMKQPGYKRLSDEQKAQAVASVYEYATGKGKMEVSKWKPDDSSIVKGVLKSMLPVESYILYRLNSDRDKSGSVNGAESALTLLELNGLSNQQRGKAWDALNDIKEDKNPFIGALPEAGVQSKTAIDIYDRYRELNNARMKPKDKAAEFLSYVRGLGLTSEQLKAVKNTYTFFGSYPIEW